MLTSKGVMNQMLSCATDQEFVIAVIYALAVKAQNNEVRLDSVRDILAAVESEVDLKSAVRELRDRDLLIEDCSDTATITTRGCLFAAQYNLMPVVSHAINES